MSIPSRSRSLREPGYTHRELREPAKRSVTLARPGLKNKLAGAESNPHESEEVNNALHKGNDEPPISHSSAGNENEKGNAHHLRLASSIRGSRTLSTQNEEPGIPGRQMNVNARRNGGTKAETNSRSSGLPLPSQLSRSSSLRQPTGSSNRGEAGRSSHSRYGSVAVASTDSNSLPIVPEICSAKTQRGCPPTTQTISPSIQPSAASRIAPIHQRSHSIGVVLGNRPPKHNTDAQNHFSSVGRPQFSTFQQHFSPKKQKLQIRPPAVSSNSGYAIADLHHIIALQDELLQLQCMFSPSHTTLQAWTESATREINEYYEKHIQETSDVMAIEKNQQMCINGAGLRAWLGMDAGQKHLENVESLAQCVQTLTNLTRPRERLPRVIEQFEAWYENTIDTLGGRSGGRLQANPRLIQPLEQSWTDTVASLVRTLQSCLQKLQALGAVNDTCAVGLVLEGHLSFTQSILDELETIESIHSMVLDQEDDWIKRRISSLFATENASDLSSCNSKRPTAWNRVP
jgi:hypothetical protein